MQCYSVLSVALCAFCSHIGAGLQFHTCWCSLECKQACVVLAYFCSFLKHNFNSLLQGFSKEIVNFTESWCNFLRFMQHWRRAATCLQILTGSSKGWGWPWVTDDNSIWFKNSYLLCCICKAVWIPTFHCEAMQFKKIYIFYLNLIPQTLQTGE